MDVSKSKRWASANHWQPACCSQPCVSPHPTPSSTLWAWWSKPYLAQGASHVGLSAPLLCLWSKCPAGRLDTKVWGATNLPPCEAGQGGGLWLRRHLCPQNYMCDLAHHISCCSLPVQRARAADRAGSMKHSTKPRCQAAASRDRQGILGGAGRVLLFHVATWPMAETTVESHYIWHLFRYHHGRRCWATGGPAAGLQAGSQAVWGCSSAKLKVQSLSSISMR